MKNVTWKELVRELWGQDTTDKEIETLLWSCTCFPFGTAEQVEMQLKEIKELSGRDINKAQKLVKAEVEKALKNLDEKAE